MKVTKEFTFHAAHRDEEAPPGDQCGRLHGHTYRLRLTVDAERGERGMVLHGDVFKQFYRSQLEPRFEHQYLNETLEFNPTMEAVAHFCASAFDAWLTDILNVGMYTVMAELWETPTMFCKVEL